jgi:D-lactate dehydrogenase (cytochrome)
MDHTERNMMWAVRHHMFETKLRVFPNYRWQLMDIAVPISSYPQLISYVSKTMQAYEINGYAFGHAGDGNLHVELPYTDEEGKARAVTANDQIVYKAIDLGGTSTGEHGVGIGKVKFMAREHGPAVAVMRSIKTVLDPNGILNPGKIFRD